ncbi:orc1/cdc6 family replication initiation protein [Candidatus Bathyarchaeota archaeon]|nr:orc1/cdc6 family replication initiation protein [Candidatus Bathyarchaeota archaeon]
MSLNEPLENVFNKFLSGSKIFLNRDVLRHDYVPESLPHRSEEIQKLGSILAPSLNNQKISNVFIYGKTGTGKTAVTKYVVSRLEKKAKSIGAPITICYVNCRLAGTNYRVLAEICNSLGLRIPFTGLAVGEVLTRLKKDLNSNQIIQLTVLDEIDALIKRQEDDTLLYELTRINENLKNSWVGLIGISNDLHFKEFLDPRVLSSLSEEELVFKPYLANELYDILLERAENAFRPNVLSESSLRLCAALAAGEHGDARRALDLLRVAGEIAERNGDSSITEEHVKLAQQKIENDRISDALKSLPLHSKIVLISAYLMDDLNPEGSITGDLYECYCGLCNRITVEPLTQRRVSGLISELDIMGLLNARVVSFGRHGRTKKIRLGISKKTLLNILSEDATVGGLFKETSRKIKR